MSETGQRRVDENTPSGRNIGSPVSARDVDGFPLTYSLGGTDASSFSIVSSTGQLRTSGSLNVEVRVTCNVTVTATDATGLTASKDIVITLRDVQERPYFPASETGQRSVPENTESGENIGAPVEAMDDDGLPLTYSISGADASTFSVVSTTGQLQTRADLDHEDDSTYTFTMTVRDRTLLTETQTVTITVTDQPEPPRFPAGETGQRSVPENVNRGTNVGDPVTAVDDDEGLIRYSLSGDDAAAFSIVSTTGQIRTRADLDHEDKSSYSMTITAADPTGRVATKSVTITVTDVPEPPRFPAGEIGQRSVPENTPAGEDIGDPVAATDSDGDLLTYTLGGTDAASFTIVSSSGQLQTQAALDYEDKSRYSVTVTATDTTGLTATRSVIINVEDVNERPTFSGTSRTLENPENTPGGANIGSPISANDPEGDTLTYGLIGKDASLFSVETGTGQLKARTPFDYEQDSVLDYTVVLWVRDSKDANGNADTARDAGITVTISVTDADDPGSVTLSAAPPTVGDTLLAFLSDQDRPRGRQWQWQRSTTGTGGWDDIRGATSATYQVTASDAGRWLRATVVYRDNFGSDKSVTSSATNVPVQIEISIARHSSMPAPPAGIEEGSGARFVVTASRAPTTNLTVNILLSEEDDRRLLPVGAELMHTAEIRAGRTTGELVVLTEEDNVDERSGTVTATVRPGTGYTVTSDAAQSQAEIQVSDDEMPETPTGVGANGKVEYAFLVWDSLDYRNHAVTPPDLNPYTPTVLPQVWWAPSKHAHRYQVIINREDCGNSLTDLNPVTCQMVSPDRPTIVETKGGGILQSSPVSIPKGSYELSLLYAVRVRALDIEGNMSAPSEPVYMLPLHQRPKELQLVGRRAYFQVATASLFGYFHVAEFVNGKIPYQFTVCENTIPSNLNSARTVREIDGAIKTWHAIEQSFGKSLLHLTTLSTPPSGGCPESDYLRREIEVEEVRFADEDHWRAFSCFPQADGCYRTWSHILGKYGQDQSGGSAKLIPMINGRMLLRSVPEHVDSWTNTAQTHQNDCTALEHVVAHEFIHASGIGFPDFNNLSRLTHPFLETNSLGSTVAEGHIKYCQPYPHDMVAVMAIHQHFNSALTIRDLNVIVN